MIITDLEAFQNYIFDKYIRFGKAAIKARKEGKPSTYLDNKVTEYKRKLKMIEREIARFKKEEEDVI